MCSDMVIFRGYRIIIFILWYLFGTRYAYVGKYTDLIESAKLVIPRKVNSNGAYISNNLTHHYEEKSEDLHYHLQLNNETLHLELRPHSYFIGSGLIIERHKRDIRIRRKAARSLNCHFHGKIRGHDESRVSLSSCNGLVGYIRTNNAEYFIEPSKHHKPLKNEGHPHVIFHHGAVKKKKRNNNDYSRRRKNLVSNCGTKEPRRLVETRIEWQPQGEVIVQASRKIKRPNKPNRHSTSHRLRLKRSISRPRHVETLIVADSSMVAFHDDVETYILTIMSMVSSLYKDPSIGNSIRIVVVKMVLLEDNDSHPDLKFTENAQKNLEAFCSWQHKYNTDNERDPHHHDVAVLITRRNICGNDCMTLGLANVGGMCKPRRSCSVNEDNGIVLSHTIAHELGHNFGMYHDTIKTGCRGRVGSIVHIMTPTFGAGTFKVCWSNCSRKYITHFLDQGLGKCLDDHPSQIEKYQYPELPPGAMYNAELQCRLQFNLTDENIHVCSAKHEICSQLWCHVNGECVTNMRPTAPGTKCGKHKWCQNGECVPIEDNPAAVDGGWGNWSEWSSCSRTCGGGISIQFRQCDNPPPANGGSFCIGERKRYTICNKDTCLEGQPNFRAIQCSQFNNMTYMNKNYKWLPYFDRDNPCKLFCTNAEETVIANWAEVVTDGTPCKIGTKNMCVDGICRKVGCDWVIDSNNMEDRCGVCGGTDENCEIIREEFPGQFNISHGYVEITTIPAGSRHILIEEMTNSPNFLSISKANSTTFYLNGYSLISMPGEVMIASTESLYDREGDKEFIRIPGPVVHPITIYVIVQNTVKTETNNGIRYEFTLPATNSTSIFTYVWKLGDWTACTATCGGGIQYRIPLCYQGGKLIVNEELCWVNAGNNRPAQIIRECNKIPCPAHWWAGPWQLCPVTCKRKAIPDPVKRRSIMCLNQDKIVLPDVNCNHDTKPVDAEVCSYEIPLCNIDEEYKSKE